MRKIWAKIIAMVIAEAALLYAFSGFVYAGGLSGIELHNGKEALQEECSLPDPYDVNGEYGVLNQENYEFEEGYICDVYEYPVPDDITLFTRRYQDQAEKEGYTVLSGTYEGYDACEISDGQYTAYLIFMPDKGSMLLLVKPEMGFTPEAKPLALNEIAETEDYLYPVNNYAELTIDGEKETMYLERAVLAEPMIGCFFSSYYPDGRYKHYLYVNIPSDIEEGISYDGLSIFCFLSYTPYTDDWLECYRRDVRKNEPYYQADYISEDRESFRISGSGMIYYLGRSRNEGKQVSFTLDFTLGETNPVYNLYDDYWEEIYDTSRP